MLAISNQLSSREVPTLETNCEIVWTQIDLPSCKKLFVGVYYRPHIHDQLSLDELNLSLCQLDNQASNATVWLAGDFNAPNIDWETMTLKNNHAHTQTHNSLLTITYDHGLTQHITDSTRLDNTLDLFFTDHPTQVADTTILPGISDHHIVMIIADIKPKLTDHPPRKTLLYHKADWNSIRGNLYALATDFPRLLTENSDVDYLWTTLIKNMTNMTTFKNIMLSLTDMYILSMTCSKRPHLYTLGHKPHQKAY